MRTRIALSSVMATIILAGISDRAFAGREERLMKMSEAEIQEKTTVVNQPWDPAIIILQKSLPSKGTLHGGYAWLDAAVLTKPSPLGQPGDVLYFVGATLWNQEAFNGSSFREFAHMKYMDSAGPAFINVNQTNANGQCTETIAPWGGVVGGILPDASIERDCSHSSELLAPILRSTVEYIAGLDRPWDFQFVASDETTFTDVITPTEAKALLDRVNDVKATMGK